MGFKDIFNHINDYINIRLTGFSTPIFGISWEFTDTEDADNTNKDAVIAINTDDIKSVAKKSEEVGLQQVLIPECKISIFISSRCGDNGKYDKVRKGLKEALEKTNFASVYLFEQTEASTLKAVDHYIWKLEDSDLCVFLVDNADGITPGVQKEIDTAKKNRIKSLFYFCDETKKERTQLEESLLGENNAKCKTVHRFEDLIQAGAKAFIDDITSVYHYYCRHKLDVIEEVPKPIQKTKIGDAKFNFVSSVPSSVLDSMDKCQDYISKLTIKQPAVHYPGEQKKTSVFDERCAMFLPVLFEGYSIYQFNTALFLDALKDWGDTAQQEVISKRWEAIQQYFLGDLDSCAKHLEDALQMAREQVLPTWFINDIQLDLRNVQGHNAAIHNNYYAVSAAQQELAKNSEIIFYPLLDRYLEDLYENYLAELYKEALKPPHTVTVENVFSLHGMRLVSAFAVSMANGSLSQLLLFINRIRDFQFFLSRKYDAWYLKRDLLKYAIYLVKEKDVHALRELCPEVINCLSADEAAGIMEFCNNHPVEHDKFNSQLLGFGTVGYYLEDSVFEAYKIQLLKGMIQWIQDINKSFDTGHYIFMCLEGVHYRLKQEEIAELCTLFMKLGEKRFFTDLYKLMARCINLSKMDMNVAKALINQINLQLDDENTLPLLGHYPYFLFVLRNQNRDLTEEMHTKVAQRLPNFFRNEYKLETTVTIQKDYADSIANYLNITKADNAAQGKNGQYSLHNGRELETIRRILMDEDFVCEEELLKDITDTAADTLLKTKQDLSTKVDAVGLLLCVALKYNAFKEKNLSVFTNITDQEEQIEVLNDPLFTSNVNVLALKIGIRLLKIATGQDAYQDFLELMPYIQNDKATTSAVTDLLVGYLEAAGGVRLPSKIEMIVLQNDLQWLNSEYLKIRWNAVRILFAMLRNEENRGLVNRKLLNLIDSEGFYIKNLILRQSGKFEGITKDTKDYIFAKCENDSNFVVRLVCEEEKGKMRQ